MVSLENSIEICHRCVELISILSTFRNCTEKLIIFVIYVSYYNSTLSSSISSLFLDIDNLCLNCFHIHLNIPLFSVAWNTLRDEFRADTFANSGTRFVRDAYDMR